MLLRSVLSRIHKHQSFANFCVLKNAAHSLACADNASSLFSFDESSTEKGYLASSLVNSFELSPEKANSASKMVHFDGPDKSNAVLNSLEDIIGVGSIETCLRRGSWIFNMENEDKVITNVDFLREIGVPRHCIELALLYHPEIFRLEHVELREIVEELKQMGFDPLKSMFVMAVHALAGKRNRALWDQCYEVYSGCGWSKDDILIAFRKHPNCMLLSAKKISMAMDFLVNKLGREPRSLVRCPNILMYNMEERIVPRCSIVHLLSLKGLVKRDWSLASVLCPVEQKFLEKYVMRYIEKLPRLYDIYLSKKIKGTEA